MTGFTRTISGLNNQHLFYNVDIVVFVEGGPMSFNFEDVCNGKYTEETEDSIFWSNIFKKFSAKKKVKFKSIGSKSTIKEIAVDVVSGKLTSVFICMDSEFDGILSKKIVHPHIYYTHGYSYENDIWNEIVVKAVIEELTAVEISGDEIDANFNTFLQMIRVAVIADAYLFKKGRSFFPRKGGYLFCIDCIPKFLPTVKRADINSRINLLGLKKSTLYSFGRRFAIEVQRDCYGHLLADYCCQLIIHYIRKRHSIKTVSKDIIYRIAIGKFFKNNFSNGKVFEYYSAKFKEQ